MESSGGSEKRTVRRSTLVVTNTIKLAGLVVGVNEMLTTRNMGVVAACIVMMSGVQGLEDAVVLFFQRFFGLR